MIPRNDLAKHPELGVEIFQLTSEPVPASHVYMEAQVFTPDSQRLVLHRSVFGANPAGRKDDPQHRYLLCDLADGGKLLPLTDELGATAPAVSPDGKYFYYFLDRTQVGSGALTLRRRNIDGSDPQTLQVIDAPLAGTPWRPSNLYQLSTIRSDGKSLATAAFLGDGNQPGAPFGLLVFDLVRTTVSVALAGTSWCNLHPQYCRSTDPQRMHDLMVQENHGARIDAAGKLSRLTGDRGGDIHVIRDDGMHLRDLPWGRDGIEFCQGHQCWRGRSEWAITSTAPEPCRLIESRPVPGADHDGLRTPDGIRNDLTRGPLAPWCYHFATDIEGARLATDHYRAQGWIDVAVARLGRPGEEAVAECRSVVRLPYQDAVSPHIHPFLSPDGKLAFFQSDESGTLQAYMIRHLPL